jgi:hypothetical protein
MKKTTLLCFAFVLPFLGTGCDKKPTRRNLQEQVSAEEEEGGGSGRARDGAGKDGENSRDVEVEVEAGEEFQPEPEPEIEVETVSAPQVREIAQPGSSQKLIALKITVKNHVEDLQMLVAPQRFFLETADGAKIRPTFRELQGPMLREGYLKDGDKVTGWVVFYSPEKKEKLFLVADLRDPPIKVPVFLSGG